MATTQPIRNVRQVQKIISYYKHKGEMRNHLLLLTCVHTALRISDVLRLSWGAVYDFKNNCVRGSVSVVEKKTGKRKVVALHRSIAAVLEKLKASAQPLPNQPLFLNKRTGKAIGRVQAYRIIRAAADAVKYEENVSCHSLRKTFGYHAWKNGASPAVIMEIFNHSSFAVTRRYLGVSQDDKNAVYMGLDFAMNI